MSEYQFAYRLNDVGNAERLIEMFGDMFRWCRERKQWLIWDEKRWWWADTKDMVELAKKSALAMYHEAASIPDKEPRTELLSHAKRSESDHNLNAMVNLAATPDTMIRVTELDANPYLFNCLNGTIDLRTGQLMPHRKEDLQTVLIPVEYSPEATCPKWDSFLAQITGGDTGLVSYLQKAVGYSLSGETKTQVVFFLYGLGCNGKSTFVGLIRKLTGDYGARVNAELFMLRDKNQGGPKEGLANLFGKRFVVASELEDGRQLAVGLVKDMTGGETIRADRKHEHEFEYKPTYKPWLVGNHKPTIKDTTFSIWRRVKLVPFTVTIPPADVDIDLPAKLEAELPGILAWAVRGCLDWQRYGLGEPDAVATATATYRHEQDILVDFIEDCCILEPLATLSKSTTKELYSKWCADNGMEPVSQKTFKNRLMERGVTEYKGSGGQRFWRGIRAKTPEELAESGKTPPPSKLSGKTGQEFPGFSLYKENIEKNTEIPATVATLATVAPGGNGHTPDYTAILGMPVAEVLAIWELEGKPVVFLGDGNTEHLDQVLNHPKVSEQRLKGIREWLDSLKAKGSI